MTHQAFPSGTADADRIAREVARLRGPEIAPGDGTLVAEELRAQGGALAAARAAVRRAVAQAHPGTATDLLPGWEDEYGLSDNAPLPTDERQRRLLVQVRARGDGSLPVLARAVRAVVPDATLLAIASEDVAHANPDAVFSLVVLVSLATMNNRRLMAQIDAILGEQLTGHAAWTVGRGAGPDIDAFRCDDPQSLCDIDLLST